jgi:hypothetical protein
MHGVVFAVDGQDRHIAFPRSRGEDLAGSNHALFIRKADGLSGQNSRMSGFEPRDAHNGRHDEIGIGMCGAGYRACRTVHDLDSCDTGSAQPFCQLGGQFFGGQRNKPGPPPQGLLQHLIHVASRSQSSYAVALGKLLNDRKSALPDRACRAENGESLQGIRVVLNLLIIAEHALPMHRLCDRVVAYCFQK